MIPHGRVKHVTDPDWNTTKWRGEVYDAVDGTILEFYEGTDPAAIIKATSDAVAAHRGYTYRGDWIVAPYGGCTCGTGGTPQGHEPGCGWEPIAHRRGAYLAEPWESKWNPPVVSAVCPGCGERVRRPALSWGGERLGVLVVVMGHDRDIDTPGECHVVWPTEVVQ